MSKASSGNNKKELDKNPAKTKAFIEMAKYVHEVIPAVIKDNNLSEERKIQLTQSLVGNVFNFSCGLMDRLTDCKVSKVLEESELLGQVTFVKL